MKKVNRTSSLPYSYLFLYSLFTIIFAYTHKVCLTDLIEYEFFFFMLEVCVQITKHFDVIKGQGFLIHEKSPLSFNEGGLIALFKKVI